MKQNKWQVAVMAEGPVAYMIEDYGQALFQTQNNMCGNMRKQYT